MCATTGVTSFILSNYATRIVDPNDKTHQHILKFLSIMANFKLTTAEWQHFLGMFTHENQNLSLLKSLFHMARHGNAPNFIEFDRMGKKYCSVSFFSFWRLREAKRSVWNFRTAEDTDVFVCPQSWRVKSGRPRAPSCCGPVSRVSRRTKKHPLQSTLFLPSLVWWPSGAVNPLPITTLASPRHPQPILHCHQLLPATIRLICHPLPPLGQQLQAHRTRSICLISRVTTWLHLLLAFVVRGPSPCTPVACRS